MLLTLPIVTFVHEFGFIMRLLQLAGLLLLDNLFLLDILPIRFIVGDVLFVLTHEVGTIEHLQYPGNCEMIYDLLQGV